METFQQPHSLPLSAESENVTGTNSAKIDVINKQANFRRGKQALLGPNEVPTNSFSYERNSFKLQPPSPTEIPLADPGLIASLWSRVRESIENSDMNDPNDIAQYGISVQELSANTGLSSGQNQLYRTDFNLFFSMDEDVSMIQYRWKAITDSGGTMAEYMIFAGEKLFRDGTKVAPQTGLDYHGPVLRLCSPSAPTPQPSHQSRWIGLKPISISKKRETAAKRQVSTSSTHTSALRLSPQPPAFAYFLHLNMYDENSHDDVAVVVPIWYQFVLYPYLSVYCTDLTSSAINQAARFAAEALYNRWHLWKQTGTNVQGASGVQDFMKHYTVFVTKNTWHIYQTVPESLEGWEGCQVQPMKEGVFSRNVHRLLDCLNYIHNWALKTYAPQCMDDIEKVNDTKHGDRLQRGEKWASLYSLQKFVPEPKPSSTPDETREEGAPTEPNA